MSGFGGGPEQVGRFQLRPVASRSVLNLPPSRLAPGISGMHFGHHLKPCAGQGFYQRGVIFQGLRKLTTIMSISSPGTCKELKTSLVCGSFNRR